MRIPRTPTVILGCWTVVALVFAPQIYVANRVAPVPLPDWVNAVAAAALFYSWAALTPVVLWLARRYPLQRGRFVRAILQHIVASLVVCVVQMIAVSVIHAFLPVPREHVGPIPQELMIISIAASNIMFYWSILAVAVAIAYFRRDQEREVTLLQAQLQSLRAQLQPHFLFNTLNAIAELIYEDPPRAERTVTQLSDVLRMTLQHEQQHEITLEEELDVLRKYVEIQQTLLHERLTVRWSIGDGLLGARVPTMILQPLVENAIRHGIAPRESGGAVVVAARRTGDSLQLVVEDDGLGMNGHTPRAAGGGIGLSNTRARLQHLYGSEHRFELREREGGGFAVVLQFPLRGVPEGAR